MANFGAPLRLALNARILPESHRKLNEINDWLQDQENAARTFKTITKYMTIEKIIDHAYENMKPRQ